MQVVKVKGVEVTNVVARGKYNGIYTQMGVEHMGSISMIEKGRGELRIEMREDELKRLTQVLVMDLKLLEDAFQTEPSQDHLAHVNFKRGAKGLSRISMSELMEQRKYFLEAMGAV